MREVQRRLRAGAGAVGGRRRPSRPLLACAVALGCLALAACGAARQDAHEPKGSFPMRVVRASFPSVQAVARPATLEIEVKNTGTHAVPDVAVTLDSLQYVSDYPGLAARSRPVWAVERGPGAAAHPPVETQEVSVPGGGETAYVNTWALGRLGAGQTRTFRWDVIAVKPGRHTVQYRIAAGLSGKAKATVSSGRVGIGPAFGSISGSFGVQIASAPPRTHVNPQTGKVTPGAYEPTEKEASS